LSLAEVEAKELRLPLVEPERFPLSDGRAAARAALYAADLGFGRRFALACARFAFCGGYDLADPEVIGEAALACDLSADDVLAASRDESFDLTLDATTRGMLARGVTSGPAIRIGSRWFQGLDAVPGAWTFVAAQALYSAPLRPSG
jgi:2-hydroxychromene-2-carboxylate isomerase